MASGVNGVQMDISSQLHAKGGPKANDLQATKHDAQNTGKKLNQVLKENQKNDLIQKNGGLTPAEKQEVNDKSKMSSADEISVNLSAQADAARQSDSRIDKPDSSVREKNRAQLKHPDEVRKPSEQQNEMMEILSGSSGASMGKTARATEGAGFGGYSNRASSGLGGHEEAVGTTADVDQDHPLNRTSAKARAEGVEQDRPKETKPGQPESGVGKTIDEMI
jgi:hypothetical protein